MYDSDTVEMFVSDCGKYRARVVYDDLAYETPLREWEHDVTVIPVHLPRDVRDDYYTANDSTDYAALMRHLLDRMDEMPSEFLTAEERSNHVGAWFEDVTRGGLINEPTDAVEVFERLTGVEVTHRMLHGSVQGDSAEVIAFPADGNDSDSPSAVLDELEAHMRGEVYGIIAEKRVEWSSKDGDTMQTWEPLDSYWGCVGNDHALEAAQDDLRRMVRAAV